MFMIRILKFYGNLLGYFYDLAAPQKVNMKTKQINPFLVNVPVLYPLTIPEKQKLSDVFKWYKMKIMGWVNH